MQIIKRSTNRKVARYSNNIFLYKKKQASSSPESWWKETAIIYRHQGWYDVKSTSKFISLPTTLPQIHDTAVTCTVDTKSWVGRSSTLRPSINNQ